jgi:thymidylate synthase ThyX/gamma-glutamylcyclotransferase (GGCT)/AIG2-like uncharacterized protein YtfP
MKIIIQSLANAEDNAMLQALYSRSAESVTTHLERVEKAGSGKFMAQYYLGYGHASIGDCGSDTVFIEGVSMLAAKAIEDNPLFVGQECSSRYIDFSTQEFYVPCAKVEIMEEIHQLYNKFRAFYTASLEPLKAALRERFPKKEDDKDTVYEKAIAARAFDILRGFLPAGATTNVAWSFRLSNADEHLRWMMHHPLEEVKRIGALVYEMLHKKYPNSFHKDYADVVHAMKELDDGDGLLLEIEGDATFTYLSQMEHFYTEFKDSGKFSKIASAEDVYTEVEFDEDLSIHLKYFQGYKARQRKTRLPKHSLVRIQSVYVSTMIDFGSFRDIQRHRNGYCNMPMLTCDYGIHPWYYENLTEELRKDAYILLNEIEKVYTELRKTEEVVQLQYILPMGFIVPTMLKYDVGQAVYVAELRSGKTVHATLRPVAQKLAASLEELGIPVFYDKEESDWTVKRGEQDIVSKS